jgi:hypothetical protein
MSLRHLLLMLCVAAPAFAGDPAAPPHDEEWRRELDGHVFVPSLVIADPFVSTYLSLNAGAGYAWIDGPGFDLRGNVIGGNTYKAAAMAQALTFQASITHWLAVRIGGAGGLNGGDNGRSVLVVGAVIPINVDVGATVSWHLGHHVRLGGTFDFTYSDLKLVQPLTAVRNSLGINQVDTMDASRDLDTFVVQPGAVFAWAPLPLIGVLASVQYLWSGFYDPTTSVSLNYFVIGVGAQIDLRARFPRVPVGIQIAYRTQIPFESGTRFSHTLESGIFYTGRRAIDLGLDLQYRWFDLRPDTRTPFDTFQLVTVFLLRYHWN